MTLGVNAQWKKIAPGMILRNQKIKLKPLKLELEKLTPTVFAGFEIG